MICHQNPNYNKGVSAARYERVYFADIARSFGVIYFMWCHAVNIHVQWIDTWAMPVFFVVMGMFYKPTDTWREMIVKKVNTILVPFFILSVPSYIQYAITLPLKDFILKVVNPFACVHGVGWFLICMFFCYLIYYGIGKVTKFSKVWTIVLCIVLSLLSFYASMYHIMGYRIKLPFFISTSLTVLPFICAGDYLQVLLKNKNTLCLNLVLTVVLLFVSLGGAFLFKFRGGEFIENGFYGQSWPVYMIISMLGTFSILFISKFLPHFLGFPGEHSLLFLMVHPYILRILRLFDISGYIMCFITLVLTIFIIWCLSKYLPVVEGKKRIIK